MKKVSFIRLAMLAVLLAFFGGCSDEQTVKPIDEVLPTGTAIEGKYIVVLKISESMNKSLSLATYEQAQAESFNQAVIMLKKYDIPSDRVFQTYGKAIVGFAADLSSAEAQILANDPNVLIVEQDKVISIESMEGTEVGEVMAQTVPWGITRVGGAAVGTGKTAWIIDSGIDLDHPDLLVDVALSKSFVLRVTSPDDQNGHGTHVAGTVAALNNTIGVVGVAAGAKVVAVRVLDRKGSGTTSGVIAGVDYVAANGVVGDAANMSLGGGVSDILDAAVLNASSKVKFALAAGNETDNANNHSPARVNGPNIYTISAMDNADKFASFSNYGNPPVDYCAPGVSIYSCYKGGVYATLSGTSMATPHVCGLLLLGNIATNGYVLNDPDGNPDPIAHR